MPGANVTMRIVEQFWSLCLAGEIDAALAMMDASFVHDDRRRVVANKIIGRDQTMENNVTFIELGVSSIEFDVIDARSDRLVAARGTFRTAGGDEIDALQVLGTNAAGLRTFCVSFEPNALDDALAELDVREHIV